MPVIPVHLGGPPSLHVRLGAWDTPWPMTTEGDAYQLERGGRRFPLDDAGLLPLVHPRVPFDVLLTPEEFVKRDRLLVLLVRVHRKTADLSWAVFRAGDLVQWTERGDLLDLAHDLAVETPRVLTVCRDRPVRGTTAFSALERAVSAPAVQMLRRLPVFDLVDADRVCLEWIGPTADLTDHEAAIRAGTVLEMFRLTG